MNKIIKLFLLSGEKLMQELYLGQPGLKKNSKIIS